jgi:hypothetical protein
MKMEGVVRKMQKVFVSNHSTTRESDWKPSGQSLLIHLKVKERATCSVIFLNKVGKTSFMLLDWKEVTISSSLREHSKFHMYVFDGIKVKKENKVWGPKHKQPNGIPKKKIILFLTFDRPHVQQAITQSCNVDEVNNRTSGSKEMMRNYFSSCSMFPTFINYLTPYSIYFSTRNSSYLVNNFWTC